MPPVSYPCARSFEVITVAQAVEELEKLSIDSATGPNILSANLLKRFALELEHIYTHTILVWCSIPRYLSLKM